MVPDMTTFGLHTVIPKLKRNAATAVPADHPHAQERARRVLNVVVAAVGLILAAPLMALVAVAIKIFDPGPILYRQTRVGLCLRNTQGGNFRRKQDIGGKPFTIYKFRTMRVARPGDEVQVWASVDDPRITKLGKFLRKTRLDEIPQLYNVLIGDMNVVGPRPEQPEIFKSLRQEVEQYSARQRVRPGITGRAQITLQYDSCIEDVKKKVAADLEYIRTQSLVEDLRIMALTAPVMIFRKGSR
jgi:lipopolysaccharide/colanic/teichoic acid biosynthesis glycosyltransferase